MKTSLEQDLLVNLIRCADQAVAEVAELLKPHALTPAQFEVLRVLHQAAEGLACNDIGSRLLARDPDITRLLDRLERRGLVQRARSREDRRVVMARNTPEGHDLAQRTLPEIRRLYERQFAHLGPERAQALVDLLRLAQERPLHFSEHKL